MSTVATLDTVMRLNSAAFRQGMVQAANQANTSLTSIQRKAQQTASVILQMKRAAETFGSFYLLKEGIGSLLEAQVQLQAIHYTLIAATGSSSKAADAFGFVRAEADKLGLILPDAAQGFANLSASATAAGVSMKDQQQLFDAYAKSATSLHLSTVQSNRALLALEQMFAKGKIQAQELRLQLGQAIPGAAQRFQNAVMEMTKGTDLAGKSFDQLLEAGALTTSKFLPALVSALQQSGRGWEDASKGLNASLNRVQTAWFNLKTELTDGLFTDAATAGAGALADNLSRIAGLIALIGAGGLAKIGGTALSSGADRVTRLQQEYQGARMAAAAEVKYASTIEAAAAANLRRAEAAALENQVIKDAAASALADAKAREIEAFGIKEAALAEMQRVEAAAALNEAMAAGSVAKRTSVELDARLAATSKALIAAEGQLTKALVTQAAARDTLALAEGRQAALRGGVLEASAAASAAAATASKVRTAEAALGGFAAAAGRAAKSFGAFALSLVGGPWGAAIAAVGALGYAIYKVNKDWEDYLKHADEVSKSNEEVTQTLKDMAAAYADVNSRPDAAALRAGLDGAAEAAAKARKELDDLIAKRAELQDQRDRTTARGGPGFLIDPKIAELDAKIAHARLTMGDLTAAASKTQMQLAAELAPAIRNSAGPALDFLATKVYGASNAYEAMKALINAPADFGNLVASATASSKFFKDLGAQMDAAGASALKFIQTNGKTKSEVVEATYAQAKQDERYRNGTAEYKKDVDERYRAALALTTGQDAIIASHKKAKTAVDQAAEAYTRLKASQAAQLLTLKEQRDGTAGASEAQKTLNRMTEGAIPEFNKMTAAKQADAIATQKQIVAEQQALDLQNLKIDAARKLADLDRELAREQAERAQKNASEVEGVGHGSQWNAERQALDAVTAATRQKMDAENTAYRQAIDLGRKQNMTAAERKVLDEAHLQMLGRIQLGGAVAAQQTVEQFAAMKAAQSDWKLGVAAALDDYGSKAANVAESVKEATTSAFTAMEDSLVSFATTGKLNFRSFATSVLTDIARMEVRILESKVAAELIGLFSGGVSYGGGSGAASGTGVYSGFGAGSTKTVTYQANGGVFTNSPSLSAYSGTVVNRPTPFMFAAGAGIMGEAGPEAILPLRRGPGGKLGVAASVGGGGAVTIYQTINVESSGKATEQGSGTGGTDAVRAFAERMKTVAKQAIADEMRPGGTLWRMQHA